MSEKTPVPDWLVERLARGELSPVEAERVRARLSAENGLGRLAALTESDRQILAAHPPAEVAAEVRRRAALHTPAPRRAWFALPVLAMGMAGLALVVSGRLLPDRESGNAPLATDEHVTVKGLRPHLVIYRKTAAGVEHLVAGARVHGGDTLQVAYVAAGDAYGVIASVDARGTVTLHLPTGTGAAAKLTQGGQVALPESYELDDSPGFERFVFVTAARPFETATVTASLRPAGPSLPRHLSAFSLTLPKE